MGVVWRWRARECCGCRTTIALSRTRASTLRGWARSRQESRFVGCVLRTLRGGESSSRARLHAADARRDACVGCLVQVRLARAVYSDGTDPTRARLSVPLNHTFNEEQIVWFHAGSALNAMKVRCWQRPLSCCAGVRQLRRRSSLRPPRRRSDGR